MRTHFLIDQLAELAGQRNRELLDGCFMDLFEDLLAPRAVSVMRPTGREDAPRWNVHRQTRIDFDDTEDADPIVTRTQSPGSAQHEEAWNSGQLGQVHRPDGAGEALTLVPMGCQDETQCLIEIRSARPITPEQERMVRGVQQFYRNLRNLMDENERDSLTRLLNRKSFDETFLRMAMQLDPEPEGVSDPSAADDPPDRRQASEGLRCWLGVVDIDHFKRVNDSHGHLIGDEVLILVAQQMRQTFRRHDRLYRFGGEEFVVLLQCDASTDAGAIFERLRSNVEKYDFPRVGRLTVSVGFTEVNAADTPSAAFERADQAVYHVKSNGRNQSVGYERLVSSGAVQSKEQVNEVEFF